MFDSTGAFLSASEDSTGTLEQIEKKIARVTMLPIENGEVDCLRLKSGLESGCHFSYIASKSIIHSFYHFNLISGFSFLNSYIDMPYISLANFVSCEKIIQTI